jgi:hypothetical protein
VGYFNLLAYGILVASTLRSLGTDGRIILKRIVEKCGGNNVG